MPREFDRPGRRKRQKVSAESRLWLGRAPAHDQPWILEVNIVPGALGKDHLPAARERREVGLQLAPFLLQRLRGDAHAQRVAGRSRTARDTGGRETAATLRI